VEEGVKRFRDVWNTSSPFPGTPTKSDKEEKKEKEEKCMAMLLMMMLFTFSTCSFCLVCLVVFLVCFVFATKSHSDFVASKGADSNPTSPLSSGKKDKDKSDGTTPRKADSNVAAKFRIGGGKK
jgi:hypothetical protein